jgi:hypothetical protein
MNAEREATVARRYLLGRATEDERATLEREYFENEAAIDHIAAAEDELIEDYLANQLSAAERGHFERDYLATAGHRRRVDTIKRLTVAAQHKSAPVPLGAPERSKTTPSRGFFAPQWLALAATLALVTAASFWLLTSSRSPEVRVENRPPATAPSTAAPQQPEAPPTPSATPSRVFAVVLAPIAIRSASDSPTVTVPAGIDLVAIRLEGDRTTRALAEHRASIRTVEGKDVWKGAAIIEENVPPGIIARIDVPAGDLPANDYVVTLFAVDAAGAEQQRARYFLRIRQR